MRRRWIAALAVTTVVALDAQTAKPSFELASVKRNVSGHAGYSMGPRPGGAFEAGNVPMSVLIEFAYEVPGYLVMGAPGWLQTHRFDVVARARPDAPISEMRLMMQSLLEERFRLITRKARREMSHFALVKARSDGRLGPGLRRCEPSRAPVAAPDSPEKPWLQEAAKTGLNCMLISGIALLASKVLETPVVDKTGLEGEWDFELRFGSTLGQSFGSVSQTASDPNAISFSTALEERLGLKLESTRGPIDVLVIDSVQQPTEN